MKRGWIPIMGVCLVLSFSACKAIAALPGHFFSGGTTDGGFVASVDFGRKSIINAKCITCYPSTGN